MTALKREEDKPYSYADLIAWELAPGERWELIDGVAYQMASPTAIHQIILGELYGQFYNLLKGKPCKPYIAPFEVRPMPKPDHLDGDYVEPDLFVVCDRSKIDTRGCKGPPDLIIEIISPSTRSVDMFFKFNKYREAGVKEYWIVDPDAKLVYAHRLKDGEYVTRLYNEETRALEPGPLPGCAIDLAAVFAAAAGVPEETG